MPAAKVNKPTNVRNRDEDIEKKLQLYGIATAFRNGKLPSNDQIDATLNSFLTSKALSSPSNKLSAEGRALVADVRDVVNQAKLLLLSKNEGNLLQEFIHKTSNYNFKGVNVPSGPTSKDNAKQDGDRALEGIKTLGNLLITNGQFRKLLNDASVLLRDIMADSASSASSKLRPSEDALAQMHEPAPDNTWHETPKLSKEDLKKRSQAVYKKNKPADAPDAEAVSSGDVTSGDAQDAAKEAASNKTAEYRDRTKEYFDKKVPQENRDMAILRLKKIVIECQQHPDYQQAIQTLLDLAEKYHGHAKTTSSSHASVAQGTRSELSDAEANLKTLIERFANGTSTDNLWSSINEIYKQADKDPELSSWFSQVDSFLRRCLLQQGYVLEDSSTSEYNKLHDEGKYLLREKYRPQVDNVTDQIKFIADQFDKDPQNKAFGNSVNKLFKDLGNDENGKPTFKPHLIKDLTTVIIPAALVSLHYIPIPRIEYTDHQIDAVVENLVIESDNFTPNMFEVFNNNHVSWGRKLAQVGKNKHSIQVNVSGIQMDLRNVSYYIRRKEGFPSITDLGIFSVLLAGQGFGFKLGLSTAEPGNNQHFFKVDKVNVDIDHLNIKLHKSRHKLLFSLFKPILLSSLRPVLQKVLEKAIRDNFTKWDATLYSIKKDADRAGYAAKGDDSFEGSPPNSYSRFFTAAKNHMNESKGKKKEEAAKKKGADDGKVNIAYTKEDSIFPNINLPGGFSTKTSEFKRLAGEGVAWRSPVFTIGSAGTSSNIPKPPTIQSKGAAGLQSQNGKNGANYVNGSNNVANGAQGFVNTTATNGSHFVNGAVDNTTTTGTGIVNNIANSGLPNNADSVVNRGRYTTTTAV